MSNEERRKAAEWFRNRAKNCPMPGARRMYEIATEALEMAVRALEGDGDTISRQQAIDALHMHLMYRMGTDSNKKRLDDWINSLPSAQPERKKGKWITVPGRLGNEVECNKCHSVFWYWMGNYRFCPSCGADMRGESDETD